MPPTRAQWSIDRRRVTASTDADGIQHATVPLLDAGVHAATVVVTITPDRQATFEWVEEPGAEPLADFRAWLRPAGGAS